MICSSSPSLDAPTNTGRLRKYAARRNRPQGVPKYRHVAACRPSGACRPSEASSDLRMGTKVSTTASTPSEYRRKAHHPEARRGHPVAACRPLAANSNLCTSGPEKIRARRTTRAAHRPGARRGRPAEGKGHPVVANHQLTLHPRLSCFFE